MWARAWAWTRFWMNVCIQRAPAFANFPHLVKCIIVCLENRRLKWDQVCVFRSLKGFHRAEQKTRSMCPSEIELRPVGENHMEINFSPTNERSSEESVILTRQKWPQEEVITEQKLTAYLEVVQQKGFKPQMGVGSFQPQHLVKDKQLISLCMCIIWDSHFNPLAQVPSKLLQSN